MALQALKRREASAVGLLCKLLDFRGRGPLQQFYPSSATTPLTHSYSLRNLVMILSYYPHQLSITPWISIYRSFLGAIANIMGIYST